MIHVQNMSRALANILILLLYHISKEVSLSGLPFIRDQSSRQKISSDLPQKVYSRKYYFPLSFTFPARDIKKVYWEWIDGGTKYCYKCANQWNSSNHWTTFLKMFEYLIWQCLTSWVLKFQINLHQPQIVFLDYHNDADEISIFPYLNVTERM